MAVYDTSVVVKCMNHMRGLKPPKGDKAACEVIFSDDNCIIPPTAVKELEWKKRPELEAIREHCRFITYDDYPFNDFEVKRHIDEFVDEIRLNWIDKTPGGHSEKARLKREFNREVQRGNTIRKRCQGSGTFEHRVNDYRILKEANVLAEYGIADTLISADWSHTDPTCQYIYEKIMEEYLPEDVREDFEVKVCFYKDSRCISSSGS